VAASRSDTDALASFIGGLLSGTVDIGISMVPLIRAYNQARSEEGWREKGFADWLQSDPRAAPLLERALKRARETLSFEKRATLITALGGIPGEE